MRWVGHVACMGEKRDVYWGNVKKRGHLEDIGFDGVIILK
jgi:hypothetical protein